MNRRQRWRIQDKARALNLTMPVDCENMNIRKIIRLICFFLLVSLIPFSAEGEDFTNALHVSAEPVFPGVDWERKTNDLSPETVRGVDAFVHTLDTTGLMVVINGRLVYEHGDVKRFSYLASSRKSVLWTYQGAYTSMGSYGQYITVLPALDMVVAHKSCPPGDVSQSNYFRLLDLLTGKDPASTAELASWTPLRTRVHAQPQEHIAIRLDPKNYDAYEGKYVMAPDPKFQGTVTLTIKRDGNTLCRQIPGWFAQAIFPESETVFFNATEDEQLTFIKMKRGK
jgi:hypothetical protein